MDIASLSCRPWAPSVTYRLSVVNRIIDFDLKLKDPWALVRLPAGAWGFLTGMPELQKPSRPDPECKRHGPRDTGSARLRVIAPGRMNLLASAGAWTFQFCCLSGTESPAPASMRLRGIDRPNAQAGLRGSVSSGPTLAPRAHLRRLNLEIMKLILTHVMRAVLPPSRQQLERS